jgi:hypothetical protein
MQDTQPYLATEWGGQQWIIFAKAYPHAMNKANKVGIDHKYLREIEEDEYPVSWDKVGEYSYLSSGSAEVWRVFDYCPFASTLDGSHLPDEEPGEVEGEDLTPPYISMGLPVFRVRVEPFATGDGWSATVLLWKREDGTGPQGMDPDAILTSLSSEAFFAYLNIKQTLDSMGVAGFIEPEFAPHGSRKGFYNMDSTQERMPLQAQTNQGGK